MRSGRLKTGLVRGSAASQEARGLLDYDKERGGDFLRLLGFTRRRGLGKATYSRVFRRIDVADFESRVSQRLQGQLTSDDAPHLASGGKTARGSRDGETPGIHSVPAYVPHVRAVVGQPRADTKTDEHKAARERLGVRPVKGTIVTGDALFRHRDVRAKVIEGGGGYVLPVKKDQSTSRADIVAAFAEPEAGPSPPPDRAVRGASTERAKWTSVTLGSRSAGWR